MGTGTGNDGWMETEFKMERNRQNASGRNANDGRRQKEHVRDKNDILL